MDPEQGHISTEALFQAYAGFVARFLARLGVQGQEVGDLVQEVFLVAHSKGGYSPGPARPTTWLASIAVRVAQGARKAQRRRSMLQGEEAMAALVAGGASPLEVAMNSEELHLLVKALDALDFAHRVVFVMYELEEEPREAIAQAMGIPLGTVDSRLHTARRKVRETFARAERTGALPGRLIEPERRVG